MNDPAELPVTEGKSKSDSLKRNRQLATSTSETTMMISVAYLGKRRQREAPHEEEHSFNSRGAATDTIRPARLVQFVPSRSASLFDHHVSNCKQ